MHSPIKVLHVGFFPKLQGGVDIYLRHMAARISPERIRMDYVGFGTDPMGNDDYFAQFGGRLIMAGARNPTQADLRSILEQNGPYDIIHCNRPSRSGMWLRTARQMNVPVRIFHLHNPLTASRNVFGKFYARSVVKFLLCRYATHFLFCSDWVGDSFWGSNWSKRPDLFPESKTVYCGLDFTPSDDWMQCRSRTRRQHGIPESAFVLGNVGRLSVRKNQSFAVDVFEQIHHRSEDSRLLLVGDGEAEKSLRRKAEQKGLEHKIVFAGFQKDVGSQLAAMDAFILPSYAEGLPLVLLEAQNAGVPFIFSDGVTPEAIVIESLCLGRPSLSESPKIWAEKIMSVQKTKLYDRREANTIMDTSPFSLDAAAESLASHYERLVARTADWSRK